MTMFDALNLPPEVHSLQDAYWKARGEWEAKERGFEMTLAEMLKALEVKP